MSKPTYKGNSCEDIKALANALNVRKLEGYVPAQFFQAEGGEINVLTMLEHVDPTMAKLNALLNDPKRKEIFDHLFSQIMEMELDHET